MGSETEPAKFLLPYLQRADELQKHEPLVAYYCRLYAMERGLKIPQKERTKTTSALLVSLMNQLEKDKKSVKLGPEDSLYVEGFASNVFAKADKQDRVGRADLNTAKTFYAASIFFEILNQFGELQPDIEQRQKYAVWKAAEIRKALKEGRRPEPGPPGDDKDLSLPSSSPTNTYDVGLTDSFQPSQPNGDTSSRDTDVDPGRSESFSASYTGADLGRTQSFSPINTGAYLGTSQNSAAGQTGANLHSPGFDNVNANDPPQPHSSSFTYSTTTDYPSTDYHHLPPSNKPEIQAYPQPYPHQPYSGEQHSMPRNYHYPENPTIPYSHPNFQSYPSFHETSLPSAPSYHRTDASPRQSFPPATDHPSTPQLQPQHEYRNDSWSQTGHSSQNAAAVYTYDSSYQPPVEKIADAQKAARFAVGALAFDDLPVAVDHLRRALELLTNPSAENHKFD